MEGSTIPVVRSPITVYKARRPKKRWTFWRVVRWSILRAVPGRARLRPAARPTSSTPASTRSRTSAATGPDEQGAPYGRARSSREAPAQAADRARAGLRPPHPPTVRALRRAPTRLMLVRLDPDGKSMSLLSLPRDLLRQHPRPRPGQDQRGLQLRRRPTSPSRRSRASRASRSTT